MSQVPAPSKQPKQRWLPGASCALTFIIGTTTVLLLLCLSGWLWFRRQGSGGRQQLAVQEQRVRDAGEPLTGAELNQWYQIPDGKEDLTPLYLAILKSLEKENPPDKTDLPYVEADGNTVPLPGETWGDIARSEEYLVHFEATFALLDQTLHRTGRVRYPVDYREGLALRLPHLNELRALMRLCLLRTAVLCHRGEYSKAADTLIATIRSAETLQGEPGIIPQLVRIAIHTAVDQAIAFVLTDEQFPVEQIERLRDELRPVDRDSAGYVAMLGERASYIYPALSLTLDELLEEIQENEPVGFTGVTTRPLREIHPGDCALTLELCTDSVDASVGEYPGIWKKQLAVQDRVKSLLIRDKQAVLWNQNIVAALLLPAHGAVYTANARGVAEHRCTLVLLAAEQFRREGEAYPQRLDDLVPFYVPTLPQDPYTGEPLRMRHEEGQRFIIYTVGANELDDNGDIDRHAGGQPLDTGIAVPPFRAQP